MPSSKTWISNCFSPAAQWSLAHAAVSPGTSAPDVSACPVLTGFVIVQLLYISPKVNVYFERPVCSQLDPGAELGSGLRLQWEVGTKSGLKPGRRNGVWTLHGGMWLRQGRRPTEAGNNNIKYS